MHILFVHQNYPAQFGHIARRLARRPGVRCTFVSELPPGLDGGVERIQYRAQGGATAQTHFCSRTFENSVWHAHAVFQALKGRPDVRPDLIVGHSGFGSTVFLRELLGRTNYQLLRILLSYQELGHGLPTRFPRLGAEPIESPGPQRDDHAGSGQLRRRLQPDPVAAGPAAARLQGQVRVLFDGIDTDVWKPMPGVPRHVGPLTPPQGVKLVTHATRGVESMRGFDIFMRFARRLGERRKDVRFVVAGQERVCYGGDQAVTGGKSFKEWVLARDDYDLSRFHFVGLLPPAELARLFNLTSLHVYLTVPFVLSWSLLNALACGATVLASDTAPVREVIRDGENGILADFFDVGGMVERAERVPGSPKAYRPLGQAAAETVRESYSLEVCLPRLLEFYESTIGAPG
jgi:glycosyltransferase involved in cell wall biosynthesis